MSDERNGCILGTDAILDLAAGEADIAIRYAHAAAIDPNPVAIGHARCASSMIIAAPFSAIIAVGVLVLPEVIVGITDASMTRSPARP